MGTEKARTPGIPFTSTPPVAYDDKWWDEFSSTSDLSSFLFPSQSLFPYSDHSISHGLLAMGSSAAHSDPSIRSGNPHTIPVDGASSQETRRPSILLEAREWALHPSFASPCAASEPPFPLTVNLGSDGSQPLLDVSQRPLLLIMYPQPILRQSHRFFCMHNQFQIRVPAFLAQRGTDMEILVPISTTPHLREILWCHLPRRAPPKMSQTSSMMTGNVKSRFIGPQRRRVLVVDAPSVLVPSMLKGCGSTETTYTMVLAAAIV
ncbi:hypothetical protein L210DRAFT_2208716 [Boletus edulis BED1]|uniref:Uncharacterized protein n=1 Tax=Boletus edulis BED1 TaxID=1328754 RepID=A0AAD4BE19_BOLED|nr:hypothetical protein L210DRAFT_2208716 [Boletus edulis BED1]